MCGCRLYAALAGVEKPSDAFLQPPRRPPSPSPSPPPPPHRRSLNGRRQPSDLLAQSSTPDYGHLGTAVRISSPPPNSRSPPEGAAETPEAKRARSPSCHASSPHTAVAVIGGTAAAAAAHPSDANDAATSGVCFPPLLSGKGGCVSAPAEAQQRRTGRRWPWREGQKRWKMRLKRDLVTDREPSETFAFAGQKKWVPYFALSSVVAVVVYVNVVLRQVCSGPFVAQERVVEVDVSSETLHRPRTFLASQDKPNGYTLCENVGVVSACVSSPTGTSVWL